jgi:hypothetical protein
MSAFYTDASDAIRAAGAYAPCGIGYRKGKGWFVYDLTKGCPDSARPEFLISAKGHLPCPLSEDAMEVWMSVLRSRISEAAEKLTPRAWEALPPQIQVHLLAQLDLIAKARKSDAHPTLRKRN